jgi:hypothetical protein
VSIPISGDRVAQRRHRGIRRALPGLHHPRRVRVTPAGPRRPRTAPGHDRHARPDPECTVRMRRAVAGSSLSVPVRKDAHGASSSSEAGSPAVTSSEAAVAGMRSSISRFRALRPGRGRDARAGRNVRDASLGDVFDGADAVVSALARAATWRRGPRRAAELVRAAAGHAPGRRAAPAAPVAPGGPRVSTSTSPRSSSRGAGDDRLLGDLRPQTVPGGSSSTPPRLRPLGPGERTGAYRDGGDVIVTDAEAVDISGADSRSPSSTRSRTQAPPRALHRRLLTRGPSSALATRSRRST